MGVSIGVLVFFFNCFLIFGGLYKHSLTRFTITVAVRAQAELRSPAPAVPAADAEHVLRGSTLPLTTYPLGGPYDDTLMSVLRLCSFIRVQVPFGVPG